MNKNRVKSEIEYMDNNASYWVDPEELKNAPTIKKIHISDDQCPASGLPIISDGYTTYVDNSDTHTMIFGSTGSKKTRLFGMPLLNIFALGGESFIVTDPKGELYNKTSGFVASKGYEIIVLNFRDMKQSSMWNPLLIPYELYHSGNFDEAIARLNDFLTVLAEPLRKTSKDPYWIERGYSLALGLLLFFIDTSSVEEVNLTSFINFFSKNTSTEKAQELAEYMTAGSIAGMSFDSVLTAVDAKVTFGGIVSTASSMLTPFIMQKALCQVLSQNTFNMTEIGKKKTAIYIIVPDENQSLHFVVSIFVKQIYESLISEAQKTGVKSLPIRVNFLLDEFGNIPSIPDMHSMITAARSRNMRFFLMTQGKYQLTQKYGVEAETIIGNCDNLVFLASKELKLLRYFSELCGDTIDRKTGKEKRLITPAGLQSLRKEWDKSEVLIRHCRHNPFITVLPDIERYGFSFLPPIERDSIEMPILKLYDVDKVIAEIKDKKRPLPFSKEVHAEDRYYEKEETKNDLFDW